MYRYIVFYRGHRSKFMIRHVVGLFLDLSKLYKEEPITFKYYTWEYSVFFSNLTKSEKWDRSSMKYVPKRDEFDILAMNKYIISRALARSSILRTRWRSLPKNERAPARACVWKKERARVHQEKSSALWFFSNFSHLHCLAKTWIYLTPY